MVKIVAEFVSDWVEGEVRTPATINLISGEIETKHVVAEGYHHFMGQHAAVSGVTYQVDEDAWNDKGVLKLAVHELERLRTRVSACCPEWRCQPPDCAE